jgi:predicted Rossmann fold flavoprotein
LELLNLKTKLFLMKNKKLVVIGGGAAGFFCAINAAKENPDLEVIIIEKTGKLLSKVKVSGGGRCNVTHACFSTADMIKKYPRGQKFLKKAFNHFFTTDTINWFKERGVELKTENDGRMFPVSNVSQTIIDCFLKEITKYNIEVQMNVDVTSIENNNNCWVIETNKQNKIVTDFICIASGGAQKLSQSKWLVNVGHSVEPPVPSLFTFNIPNNPITKLMGLSVENVTVKIAGEKIIQNGPLLITHWGMSGPAVLKTSAYAAIVLANKNYDFTAIVNWIPNFNEITLKDKMQLLRFDMAATKIQNRNPFSLPSRLWEYLLQISEVKDDIRWADLPAKEQNKLIKNLCAQEFQVKGKTTFKEEFVTAGGIKTDEIDVNTMQSKFNQGLFFAGEVINVDGVTGGFNFQNAWTTGWIAANGITMSLKKM